MLWPTPNLNMGRRRCIILLTDFGETRFRPWGGSETHSPHVCSLISGRDLISVQVSARIFQCLMLWPAPNLDPLPVSWSPCLLSLSPSLPISPCPGLPVSQSPRLPAFRGPGLLGSQPPSLPVFQSLGLLVSRSSGLPVSQSPVSLSPRLLGSWSPGLPACQPPGLPVSRSPGSPIRSGCE